jgi:adenylate cyclase
MKQPVERRLAAILAADVAGYSRLMGADEAGTHERLKAHLLELVDPKVKEHQGRIVKNTGDGMLAEFSSVVEAVRCAVEVQAGMAERNATTPPDHRIEFRIGVHQGDVIIEEHDIFGDAVNVAARLEGLAEPGGICVSARVRGDAAGKLDLAFEDMGQQQLKNIARTVRVYALGPEAVVDLPASTPPPAISISQPVAAPRLSIVVLPFTNLSDDREQQYFADAITDDVTTALSRIPHMFVISRSTAFTFKDRPLGAKQIGRELGVRYVLEGSVRHSGGRIRLNAQLIDAETNAHLWAERFDHDTLDVFALQDEITSRIAVALNTELVTAEVARLTANPDALDYILRGRAAFLKPPSRGSLAEAIDWIERALALDPRSAEAQSLLAYMYAFRVLNQMTETRPVDVARAEELIAQARAASPGNPLVHLAKGQVLRMQSRYEEAIAEYEMVIAFDPNATLAIAALGHCKLATGPLEEAIAHLEQAIRLSPRDALVGIWYYAIGRGHLLQLRTDEAIFWLEKARSTNPQQTLTHAFLASAYALKNETERAASELAEACRLSADDRFSSIARLKTSWSYGVSKMRALYEATLFAGLRKAGMPEE